MKFTSPRTFWQWCVCVSPAIINILAVYQGPRLEFAIYGVPRDERADWAWVNWGIGSLLVGAAICFGLGGWFARENNSYGEKAEGAFLFRLALIAINLGIALGGCAIGPSTRFGP